MSLVPYTITALERDVADADASGKQVIVGATCSMFIQPANTATLLYDDAAGSNGSTAKTTGANGQVVVFVPQGKYRLSVNTSDSYVTVATDSPVDFGTFASLQASNYTQDYQKFTVRDRANAEYILQPSGYVALSGDATFANARVAARQYLPIFTPELLGLSVTDTTDITLDGLNKSPFSIIDNYRQFNFHKAGAALGAHAVAIPDNLFRITEASRSLDRPINACNKVLFVGDSLTAYYTSDGTYTEKVARTLMSKKGGIRDVGYIAAEPVTISAKQQFMGMSITQNGFSYFSDGAIAYSDDRRRFSPDGKGATVAGAGGSQSYYWNTTSATLVRYTKYRLYYLQQVGGGTFNLRNRGATLNAVNTLGTLGLQTVEFNFVDNGNALNKDIRVEGIGY